jgi:hypothetical protein
MIKYDDDFIRTYARTAEGDPPTPILFFHSWRNGQIKYQGFLHTLRPDGTGTAQLFEWVMGEESDTMAFTKAFLAECTFYSTDQEMRDAGAVAQRPR